MYEKQTWIDGETVVTAAMMEHIEDGIAAPTSWNDLTDKPFGETVTRTPVIPETNMTLVYDAEANIYQTSQDASDVPQDILASDIIVIWDGVEYDGRFSPFGDIAQVFGNASILSPTFENTGEPFVVMLVDTELGVACPVEDSSITSKTVVMAMDMVETEIQKIDEKFLPESTGGLPEITEESEGKYLGVSGGLPAWLALAGGGGLNVELVWENTLETGTNLNGYEIPFDKEYKAFCILMSEGWSASGQLFPFYVIPDNTNYGLSFTSGTGGALTGKDVTLRVCYRSVKVENNKITFVGHGYYASLGKTESYTYGETYCIPKKIYGIN